MRPCMCVCTRACVRQEGWAGLSGHPERLGGVRQEPCNGWAGWELKKVGQGWAGLVGHPKRLGGVGSGVGLNVTVLAH